MDGRKYRTYTKEFKLEALEILKRNGKSAGAIEDELDGALPCGDDMVRAERLRA
jgi:transposase-like protein